MPKQKPAESIQPRLLNIQQAAVYLGATVWQIRTLAWQGKLKKLRMGHRDVFDRATLDEYVEKLKRAAA